MNEWFILLQFTVQAEIQSPKILWFQISFWLLDKTCFYFENNFTKTGNNLLKLYNICNNQ